MIFLGIIKIKKIHLHPILRTFGRQHLTPRTTFPEAVHQPVQKPGGACRRDVLRTISSHVRVVGHVQVRSGPLQGFLQTAEADVNFQRRGAGHFGVRGGYFDAAEVGSDGFPVGNEAPVHRRTFRYTVNLTYF